MEWLFSHPKEPTQEDFECAQSPSLSVGNSEAPKDDANEKGTEASYEENPL